MPVGRVHKIRVPVSAGAAIAVEAKNQGRSLLQILGSVEVIFPCHSLMLEGSVDAPAFDGCLAKGRGQREGK